MKIIITSPSLDTNINVSGVSSVTRFIIENNSSHLYLHFILGKSDIGEALYYTIFRIIMAWTKWFFIITFSRNILIHFNFALDKRSILRDAPLILYAKLLHKKLIIHLHGGEYLEKENVSIGIKMLIKLIFIGKDPKIVLSPIERKIIETKYNTQNVKVLPNCIDIEDACEFNRIYSSEASIKILFLGRIVLRKGIEYIFHALKILRDKNIQFKFIMAGTGPQKDVYNKKLSDAFGSSYEFKGVVSGNTKTKLIKECDIFLLPSTSGEGLPITLLECMSYGVVPIVTDNGSMKYVVENGKNGYIVNKESPFDIANVIEDLSNNRILLSKLGNKARQLVFENYNPTLYINELNNIYNNI